MDLSRICSIAVHTVSIESVSPASITGTVSVSITSHAPTRLNLSEVRFDILPVNITPDRVILHGWAENVNVGAYSTIEVPIPVTITSIEAVRFLTVALTRDMDARVHGTAIIDAYLSKITIPFDEVVTVPSLLVK